MLRGNVGKKELLRLILKLEFSRSILAITLKKGGRFKESQLFSVLKKKNLVWIWNTANFQYLARGKVGQTIQSSEREMMDQSQTDDTLNKNKVKGSAAENLKCL